MSCDSEVTYSIYMATLTLRDCRWSKAARLTRLSAATETSRAMTSAPELTRSMRERIDQMKRTAGDVDAAV